MAVVADFLSRLEPDLGISKEVVQAHEDILNAIIGRKTNEAVSLLENHLVKIEDRLKLSQDRLVHDS